MKLLSPQAILGRLEKRLDLLTGGAHDLPTRQRTLRDAIDWSYNLLEPSEQALLARLGVFAGGCSLEVADAVCGNKLNLGEVFEGLASLVDKSLVRQSDGADGEPRFGLLETIREYALERLEADGELDELRRRHAERYLELVLAAEPELTRANQALWLVRLDEENDNIRAALTWTISSGEVELGLQLAGALVRFWSTRGLMGEGRRWLAEALAASEGVPPATLAKAYFAAGYAALGEGDFVPAKEAFDRSLRARAGGRRPQRRSGRAGAARLARDVRGAVRGGLRARREEHRAGDRDGRQAHRLRRAQHARGDRRRERGLRRGDPALRARPGAPARARRQAPDRQLAAPARSRRADPGRRRTGHRAARGGPRARAPGSGHLEHLRRRREPRPRPVADGRRSGARARAPRRGPQARPRPQRQARRRRVHPGDRGRERDRRSGLARRRGCSPPPSCCSRQRARRSHRPRRRSATSS